MALFKICLYQFINGFKDSLFGFMKFIQRQKKLAQILNESNNNANQTKKLPSLTTNTKISSTSSTSNSSTKSTLAKNHEKLYQRLLQSCLLNGIFLLSCILTFNIILIPILNWFAYKLISERNHNLITDYLNPIIQLLFSFVWILPVFLLSKIFNVLCHQEIADCAYSQKYGKPQIFQKFTIAQVIADTVFSCTMELIFLVQSSIMTLIPSSFLNQFLCHVHLSFLYSLYAFEYKFCNMSWDIKKRIHHIESRWPYYLGFGLSLSIIVSFAPSYIYSATLFASIFPAFILSAIEADSERLNPIVYLKPDEMNPGMAKPVTLAVPLFKFSIYLTDVIFKLFAKKQNNKLQSSANNFNQQREQKTGAVFNIRKTN
jgi:etoposide-induced 2.4 mRNA